MTVPVGKVSVTITNFPATLSRHVYIARDRPVSEFRMDKPLPDLCTPQDVANQFDFLFRRYKPLTKST